LGGVDLSSGTAATTRATVAGIDYAVNTNEDPTSSFFFLAVIILGRLEVGLFPV
jgi:hypothetical protein